MKIRKKTFKENQCWLSIETETGEYVGTFHIVNESIVRFMKINDSEIIINDSDYSKKVKKLIEKNDM